MTASIVVTEVLSPEFIMDGQKFRLYLENECIKHSVMPAQDPKEDVYAIDNSQVFVIGPKNYDQLINHSSNLIKARADFLITAMDLGLIKEDCLFK